MEMIKKSPVNSLIVIANVIMFLVAEVMGGSTDTQVLIRLGGANSQLILQNGEYYRLFTCMFLHAGLSHLINNMLVLLIIGDNFERAVGKVRYLLIYLVGGVAASYLSFWIDVNLTGQTQVTSVGASGAIFAVIGAMIYILIINKGRLENLTTIQLVVMAALSLYMGFRSATVDNAAHVGGLLAGFILAVIFYRRSTTIKIAQKRRRRQ
ncbi:MAG: rhomboid family intramembrane serine protease [Lachnospiraceae bacterium]